MSLNDDDDGGSRAGVVDDDPCSFDPAANLEDAGSRSAFTAAAALDHLNPGARPTPSSSTAHAGDDGLEVFNGCAPRAWRSRSS